MKWRLYYERNLGPDKYRFIFSIYKSSMKVSWIRIWGINTILMNSECVWYVLFFYTLFEREKESDASKYAPGSWENSYSICSPRYAYCPLHSFFISLSFFLPLSLSLWYVVGFINYVNFIDSSHSSFSLSLLFVDLSLSLSLSLSFPVLLSFHVFSFTRRFKCRPL